MSTRFMISLVLFLIIGIALGVLAVMLVQSLHLFAAPPPSMPQHSHW